jgi:hypothetical protein
VVAVLATELPQAAEPVAEQAGREIPPQVAARLAAIQAKKDAGLVGMTAIVPVHLLWKQHLSAHAACHAAALLWNQTVDWLHGQWRDKKSPKKEEIRRFVTSLPAKARPFHAHTAQAIAYDLGDALVTMRENKKAGRKARAPWREKEVPPPVVHEGLRLADHSGGAARPVVRSGPGQDPTAVAGGRLPRRRCGRARALG